MQVAVIYRSNLVFLMRCCFTIHVHFGCLNHDCHQCTCSHALGLCDRAFPRQQSRVCRNWLNQLSFKLLWQKCQRNNEDVAMCIQGGVVCQIRINRILILALRPRLNSSVNFNNLNFQFLFLEITRCRQVHHCQRHSQRRH